MGPASQRLTKTNNNECEAVAVLYWNKRVDYSHKITLESAKCVGCGGTGYITFGVNNQYTETCKVCGGK